MTIQETSTIMDALVAAYPHFYSRQTDNERYQALQLWAEMFKDYDYRLVAAAIKSFITTNTQGYPPTIGQIMDKLIKLLHPDDDMTEMEAWEHIRHAVSNSAYHADREFGKLPEVLQRIVGSPSTLREWGMAPIEDLQTVIQSNFMRSYRARAAQIREQRALPADIQLFLAQVVSGPSSLLGEEV